MRRRLEFARPGLTTVSFCLNVPGPVKDHPLLRRAFREGERQIMAVLRPVRQERREAFTGWEGLYLCAQPAGQVKTAATAIEETHPLGRLFDLDVFGPDGEKLSRPGYRPCLLCGRQAQLCARERRHGVAELTEKLEEIISGYFREADVAKIGLLAEQGLLYEVGVTPKPGLVDRHNNGSHQDMDLLLFQKSASVLREYFTRCALTGMGCGEAGTLFSRLNVLGRMAEADMFSATGGVNTHKGAVFSLGLLCGAAGMALRGSRKLLACVSEMAPYFLEDSQIRQGGYGAAPYRNGSCGGIRKEAALGFPTVMEIGLPALRAALDSGFSENDAGVFALLHLLAHTEDSNMVHRSDFETAAAVRRMVGRRIKKMHSPEDALTFSAELDRQFIRENLSPGGCADLLAVTWFLHRLQNATEFAMLWEEEEE